MKRVTEEKDILHIENLAREIFHKFYYPQMPKAHIDYFIAQFQTAEKITEQINSNFEYYLFFEEIKPIGYLGLEFKKSKIILSKLYILDEFRGSNIGVKGVEKAKKRAGEKKLGRIELFVNHQNLKAISFYEKQGFESIRLVTHTYANQHSETDTLMRFSLA